MSSAGDTALWHADCKHPQARPQSQERKNVAGRRKLESEISGGAQRRNGTARDKCIIAMATRNWADFGEFDYNSDREQMTDTTTKEDILNEKGRTRLGGSRLGTGICKMRKHSVIKRVIIE